MIVGRDHELGAIDEFLQAGADGLRAVVLEGAAGIGKTTLWRAAARRAEARGVRVITCQPGQQETTLALSAVADLVEGAPDEAIAALPDLQRRALEIAVLRADSHGSAPDQRLLSTAFRTLLAVLAQDSQVLVAIDDLQWLDPASATLLTFALRRLTHAPIICMVAHRVTEPGAVDLSRVAGPDNVRRIPVGPLSISALHRMLKERLDGHLTRPVLNRIHQVSGGNPLFALEIARAIPEQPMLPWSSALAVPEVLQGLVAQRIAGLPAFTVDALLACSALAVPTTDLVDEATLQPAESADIVAIDDGGRVRFRHPLYASAVYESSPRARRRAVHARLAERVNDSEQRARHLALAAAGPDRGVAAALDTGAELARRRGAWESAAELLEHAARLTPAAQPDQRWRRMIAAAEHHAHAGDRPRARAVVEAVLAQSPTPHLRAEALQLLAELAGNDENYLHARQLFADALACGADDRTAAKAEIGLAFVESNFMLFARSGDHARRALRHAEAAGDRAIVAQAMAHCTMMGFLRGHGVDWMMLSQALDREDPDLVVARHRQPTAILALLRLYLGEHAEARERFEKLCEQARALGDESDLSFTLLWFSWLETRRGDFDAAERLANQGVELAGLTGSRSTQAWIQAQQALVYAHRGEVDRARKACSDAMVAGQRFGSVLPQLWIAASTALLELSLGNAAGAWEACAPLAEEIERNGIGEPVPAFYLPEAMEALIALGELDRAEHLIDILQRRGRELDRPWALATAGRCRGLLLTARGDAEEADAAFAEALVQHGRIDLPFERARTMLARGVAYRRYRHRGRARVSIAQALAEFDRIGATRFAGRAREELRRTGMTRGPTTMLTDGEQRVAALAASGHSNRQIAAALFISTKTVEANLARAYRKLGIASRAELGGRMAGLSPTA